MKKNYNKGYWHSDCSGCPGKAVPYMIEDVIWNKVAKKKDRFLCLSCVQKRLGRKLKKKDFICAPINQGYFLFNSDVYVKYGTTYIFHCRRFIESLDFIEEFEDLYG